MFDLETLKANLIAKGYEVSCFDTAEEAADYLDAQIDQKSVGFGGSMTLKQMGLYARLNRHNTVYWHWEPGQRTDAQCRQLANAAQNLSLFGQRLSHERRDREHRRQMQPRSFYRLRT